MKFLSSVVLLFSASLSPTSRVESVLIPPRFKSAALPVVLWHGMGDTCCNPQSIGRLQKLIESTLPDTFVLSLQIGKSESEDKNNGFFMDVNKQVEMACEKIKATSELQQGYNAIGFSQGGQFLRAVAQRCGSPPMHNLISLGGQHQGVNGIPHCPGSSGVCALIRSLLQMGAYSDYVQHHLVQAQYWHDPTREDEYRQKSLFLADINNERTPRNATYKANLVRLDNFVMVQFANDTMVSPKESEWFGYFTPGQAKTMQTLQNSALYKQDWLGLRQLDKAGKLHFLSVPGDHLRFSETWFVESIIKKFLAR